MKRIPHLLISLGILAQLFSPAWAQNSVYFNPQLLNWLKFNVSPVTQLPYSFYISPKNRAAIYQHMQSDGPLKGSIERTITHEGMDIYDGAVYQMVLSLTGDREDLKKAALADEYYWQGSVGDTWNIRSGFPINTFIYNPKNPESVSSDINQLGKRGFIFRIIDADGNYLVTDPWDGKKNLKGFPDNDRLHWVDWKPVAGENAWVVMAALQIYHQDSRSHAIELKLSQELARAAMILQSDCGGVRMAPLGTYRNLVGSEAKYFTPTNWWYNHISTENNLSWYAAFRMLYQITGNAEYKQAMQNIEQYLKFVWNKRGGYFYQGAYWNNGQWMASQENFALDVQMWSINCLRAQRIDEWFGTGAAWRLWQAGVKHSGVYDRQNQLMGVGYSNEHQRISVEWSAGAMLALDELARYYQSKNPLWAKAARNDKISMRASMEKLHYYLSQQLSAYSYSSQRAAIPFGWNSHDPEVLSLASTGWMIFVDAGFNPFWLL